MATIAHSTIVNAMVALLRAAPALADGGVHRSRGRAAGEGISAMVVVRKEASQPQQGPILSHPIDWLTSVAVECYARGSASQAPDEAADELLLAVNDLIVADPTLGGLALDVQEPRLTWDTDEQDKQLGCSTAIYTVLHRTRARTLAA